MPYYTHSQLAAFPQRPEKFEEALDILMVGILQNFVQIIETPFDRGNESKTLSHLFRATAAYTLADCGEYWAQLDTAAAQDPCWHEPLSEATFIGVTNYLNWTPTFIKNGMLSTLNPSNDDYLNIIPRSSQIKKISEKFGWRTVFTICQHWLEVAMKLRFSLNAEGASVLPAQELSIETVRMLCFICLWGEKAQRLFAARISAGTTTDEGYPAAVNKFREKLTELRPFLQGALAALCEDDAAYEYAILPQLLQQAFAMPCLVEEEGEDADRVLTALFGRRYPMTGGDKLLDDKLFIAESQVVSLENKLRYEMKIPHGPVLCLSDAYQIHPMRQRYYDIVQQLLSRAQPTLSGWLTVLSRLRVYCNLFDQYALTISNLETRKEADDEKEATRRDDRLQFLELFPDNVGGRGLLSTLAQFEVDEGKPVLPLTSNQIWDFKAAFDLRLGQVTSLLNAYEKYCDADRVAQQASGGVYYRFPRYAQDFQSDYASAAGFPDQVALYLQVLETMMTHCDNTREQRAPHFSIEMVAHASCFVYFYGLTLLRYFKQHWVQHFEQLFQTQSAVKESARVKLNLWQARLVRFHTLLDGTRLAWLKLVTSAAVTWEQPVAQAQAIIHLHAAFLSEEQRQAAECFQQGLLLPHCFDSNMLLLCSAEEYYTIVFGLVKAGGGFLAQESDPTACMRNIVRFTAWVKTFQEYNQCYQSSDIPSPRTLEVKFSDALQSLRTVHSNIIREGSGFIRNLQRWLSGPDPLLPALWESVQTCLLATESTNKQLDFEKICIVRFPKMTSVTHPCVLSLYDSLRDHYFEEGAEAFSRLMRCDELFRGEPQGTKKDFEQECLVIGWKRLHQSLRSELLKAKQSKNCVPVLRAAWLLKQFVTLCHFLERENYHWLGANITTKIETADARARFIKILNENKGVFAFKVLMLFVMRMSYKGNSAKPDSNDRICLHAWNRTLLASHTACPILGGKLVPTREGFWLLGEVYCRLGGGDLTATSESALSIFHNEVVNKGKRHWNSDTIGRLLQKIETWQQTWHLCGESVGVEALGAGASAPAGARDDGAGGGGGHAAGVEGGTVAAVERVEAGGGVMAVVERWAQNWFAIMEELDRGGAAGEGASAGAGGASSASVAVTAGVDGGGYLENDEVGGGGEHDVAVRRGSGSPVLFVEFVAGNENRDETIVAIAEPSSLHSGLS